MVSIEVTSPKPVALSKVNARNVRINRQHLALSNTSAYAAGMAGIHRSSSRQQQLAVEQAIIADDMQGAFYRHPTNGCMMAYRIELAA